MKRLFGTDGIRGVAGEAPLDPSTVRRFGAALARLIGDRAEESRVVLGRDTRESGPWLRDAISAGLRAHGAQPVDAGVITTPGLARVLQTGGFAAGVMISASHNPFEDNGLKAFGENGAKLPDATERHLERMILDDGLADPGEGTDVCTEDPVLIEDYIRYLESVLPDDSGIRGLKLVLDCSNGAASGVAPEVFRHHGAEVRAIGNEPDGRNINLNCGSLHLDRLASEVQKNGFDLGLAFDGDADRCLAVDRRGRTIDGDHILFLIGRRFQREGHLRGSRVVATIMSNLWLEERLGAEGIGLVRTSVGDKYVMERMQQDDLALGGEQSGHVIVREHATTGDGVLTGLLLADTIARDTEPIEQILDGIVPYPQLILNVRVGQKPDLRAHAAIGPIIAEVEAALGEQGRLVLRYSGTEPLARVMIEGRDDELVRGQAERLAGAIERELGNTGKGAS